jgi:Rrf2 family protein
MFSQTVEYSLRAVVTLAQNKGKACTAQQISELTQVPGPYLSKVMQVLVRSGLVHSQRGLHGGFVLAKEPSEINILDVVDAVEPFKRIRTCPLGLETHDELCPLHRCLDQGMALAEQAYRTTTIDELLTEPDSVTPLCEIPKPQPEPASTESPVGDVPEAKGPTGGESESTGTETP